MQRIVLFFRREYRTAHLKLFQKMRDDQKYRSNERPQATPVVSGISVSDLNSQIDSLRETVQLYKNLVDEHHKTIALHGQMLKIMMIS